MTEYDYSPEAMERHLATQQRIARWVDQTQEQSPSNPFAPLPGEHTTQVPHTQPQPAFYATPQGVISPTYSRRRGRSRHHSPSPRSTSSTTPPLAYRPVVGRSFSTPPSPVRHFYSVPSTPYIPYPSGSPYNPLPYTSPYQPSPISHPISHPSFSQSSFHSGPSSYHSGPSSYHSLPIAQPQPRGNHHFQPSPLQPVVIVNRGGGGGGGGGGSGGYVFLPAPGQHVQVVNPQPVYEVPHKGANQGHGFFGKLKGFGTKSSKSKKSKRSGRDSY